MVGMNVVSSSSSLSSASPIVSVFSARFFLFVVVVIFSSSSLVQCTERVQGKISKVLVGSNLSTSGLHNLPSSLDVDVRLGGHDVHLHLVKDPEFQPQVPVYVLSTDSEGRLQSERARLSDTEYAVYQDVESGAAFGVFREKDANGTSGDKLEGVVQSEGLIYHLKTTGHLSQPRHRRSAFNHSDDDGNDVKSPDDDDGVEENEEKEFEVDVLPETVADKADSLSASVQPVNTRTKELSMVVPVLPLPSSSSTPLPPPPPAIPLKKRRKRRETSQNVYVDVVVMVDYGVYTTWYSRSTATSSQKEQKTLEAIRRYYAFILNGVNLLYKRITSVSYSISVRLVSIIVAKTTSSSQWTEQNKVSATPWNRVDAKAALEALKSWVATTDLLPAYDHVMLFSGYDLTKTEGGVISNSITGLAYKGTVCKTEGQATSVVEDLGGFQCVGTAAHELGHGLSAEHDGNENRCRTKDRYIMAAGTSEVTSANKLNPWTFSTCSVNYFNQFIRDTETTERGRQCLYNTLTVDETVPDVTSQLPGQQYNPDEQCRQVYGPSSRYCRGSEFGQVAGLCTDMFCYDPSSGSTCIKLVAARGTTCGNQKWCKYGECVSDPAAPKAEESCVFGDQPGIAFEGKGCADFVDNFSGYCYQDVVQTRCCGSCARHKILLTGCLYGDRARGCDSETCSFADEKYLQSCCGTCNYGTPFTTTPTPTRNPSETCVDNPTFTFKQKTCSSLAATEPELCYDSIGSQCCRSCQNIATGTEGCEYGDRDPFRCKQARNDTDTCSTLKSVCCKTCTSSAVGVTPGVTLSVFVTVAVLLVQSVV